MTGAFPSLVTAVKAALAADPAVCPNLYVNRRRAVAANQAAAITVRLDTATSDPGAIDGAPVDWSTRIAIECYARAGDDEAALQAAHDLAAAAWARVMTDPTLGGLASGVTPDGAEWDFDNTGDALACQILNLTVLHTTAAHNLESQP